MKLQALRHPTLYALSLAVFLWSSAFVGIRATYPCYSPEGLALFRYLIASVFIGLLYYKYFKHHHIPVRDRFGLMAIGAVGIGVYNLTLNRGEMIVSSGVASIITSQTPIIIAIFAFIFLRERFNWLRVLGFFTSMCGVILISIGEMQVLNWQAGMQYLLFATMAGACYAIFQKPYLNKYHPLETTTYIMWGGTIFLLPLLPTLYADLSKACLQSTVIVFYLGIFPATIGYVAWSYALAHIDVSRAASFLYFMPFITMFLGWLCLSETPTYLAITGSLAAIAGVWLVNYSYKLPAKIVVN